MNDLVQLDVNEGVATVTLNRPERRNAIDIAMGEQFDETMVRVGLDPAVRVVVLTGVGGGFCAGADTARLSGLVGADSSRLSSPPPGSPHPVFDRLTESHPETRNRYASPAALPQPVIAAINGATAGVGLALACACDVRFASTDASFVAGFPRLGLTAEAGLAWTLQRIAGANFAADLLLSGRRATAEELLRVGVVSAVYAPDELLPKVHAYARAIAQGVSPRSARIIKRQLSAARSQTYMEAMTLAYEEVVASLTSQDFAEGLAAFKEKRPPRFADR
jgi:enoyl-CoA hydratase/carnithine racemase